MAKHATEVSGRSPTSLNRSIDEVLAEHPAFDEPVTLHKVAVLIETIDYERRQAPAIDLDPEQGQVAALCKCEN
jgi:hypothetical protein